MSRGIPPADAIVTLLSTFMLRLRSAPAAYSFTRTDGDASSATKRGIPPADAIVTLFSAFTRSLLTLLMAPQQIVAHPPMATQDAR